MNGADHRLLLKVGLAVAALLRAELRAEADDGRTPREDLRRLIVDLDLLIVDARDAAAEGPTR